jgi:hypothetical protein
MLKKVSVVKGFPFQPIGQDQWPRPLILAWEKRVLWINEKIVILTGEEERALGLLTPSQSFSPPSG